MNQNNLIELANLISKKVDSVHGFGESTRIPIEDVMSHLQVTSLASDDTYLYFMGGTVLVSPKTYKEVQLAVDSYMEDRAIRKEIRDVISGE
jgi:hypothetical protein